MLVCDRCRCPDPKNHNIYIFGYARDLCDNCNKEYAELTEVFNSMRREFLKNKTLKHIEYYWE